MLENGNYLYSLPQYLGARAVEGQDPTMAKAGDDVAGLLVQTGPERTLRRTKQREPLPTEVYVKQVVRTMLNRGCLPQTIGAFVAKMEGFE